MWDGWDVVVAYSTGDLADSLAFSSCDWLQIDLSNFLMKSVCFHNNGRNCCFNIPNCSNIHSLLMFKC